MRFKKTQSAVACCAFWVPLLMSLFYDPVAYANTEQSSITQNSAVIPLLGVDRDRNSIVKVVPKDGFQQTLYSAISSVHDSILPTLEQSFEGGSSMTCSKPSAGWSLRTVGVGVGMSAQIGLGPIWNMTVTPHLRLIFTNTKNPAYPD